MTRCQAWVMNGPGSVEPREFDLPGVADDTALLKVEASGICGTDKHVYLGHFPFVQFPVIAGHEFIGTITEMGPRAGESLIVSGGPLAVGDRVAVAPSSAGCGKCFYCLHVPDNPGLCLNRSIVYGFTPLKREPGLWGGYAEYVYLLPRSYVFKLPPDMPMKKAILIEPGATGARAVQHCFENDYDVGRSVLLLGAGPIGLMTIASLRFAGAGLIIAQDLLPERLEMAGRMGADVLIDGNRPFEERLKQVRDLTSGVGPDIVIEAAGVPRAFEEALDYCRRAGKLIEVGHFTDTGPAQIRPFNICFQDINVVGCRYSPTIFESVITMLQRTSLPVEEVVTHTFPLAEFPRALEMTGARGTGKIVITP